MFFKTENVYLYYNLRGDGNKTLVLLHGWGAESKVYKSLIEHYSQFYRVLYFDFPPFGLSGALHRDYTVSDYMVLVKKLLLSLSINNFDVLCHSFGARVASKLIPHFDAGKVVIFGGAGLLKKKTFKGSLRQIKYKFAKLLVKLKLSNKKHLLKYFSSDYLALSKDMQKTFKNIVSEDLSQAFANILNPTLLIWGENDKETPLYMGKQLNNLIKNSTLKVLADCGHYCFLENSKAFFQIADAFLLS